MILQPATNIELTKVHYFDKNKSDRNICVPTISREVFENEINNQHCIIKNNIFGHRWVLKINETGTEVKKRKKKLKLVVYVLVFCSIIVAVAFGIFFSLDKNILDEVNNDVDNSTVIPTLGKDIIILRNPTPPLNSTHEKQMTTAKIDERIYKIKERNKTDTKENVWTKPSKNRTICTHCKENEEICLKTTETEVPNCIKALDKNDPTGCGGLCLLNIQYCQLLDSNNLVYQCSNLKNLLNCPENTFNCGNMCISQKKHCDGVIHCSNSSDEHNCDCDLETHFQCGNSTSCLEKSKRCDGKVDCWDKTDEINCTKECQLGEWPCLNGGQCIKKEEFCDGTVHCNDKSDEPNGCQI